MHPDAGGNDEEFQELLNQFNDVCKAAVSVKLPLLADIKQKPYWVLFGLDQLLHQLVVVVIWYAAVFNSFFFFAV